MTYLIIQIYKLYVIECKKYNLIIISQKDFIFGNDDEVKIINIC